jgi:glycosyltransferase involved in cell wall biosynthesis
MPAPERLKLCYLCEATEGGVRRHLRLLMEHFSRPEENFAVQALFGDRGEPGFPAEVAQLRARGLEIEVLPELARALSFSRDAAAWKALRRGLARLRPDLVHTHSSKAGFLGRMAARRAGTPRILHTPHVFPFQWARGLRGAFYLALERFAARRCDRIVCVGEEQRRDALRFHVAPEDKLVVIRNAAPVPEPAGPDERAARRAELDLAPDALAVGLVGRLAPQKGAGDFLRAAAALLPRHRSVVCLLLGAGPLEAELRGLARRLELPAERFRFLGYRENAARLYPAFDVVALSSHYEGLPYVLLEAMACGVPVAATDVLGSREVIVHESSGLLVPPGDPPRLAEALLRLLDDRELRARLGAAGRARVREQFGLEPFFESHRRLYRGE